MFVLNFNKSNFYFLFIIANDVQNSISREFNFSKDNQKLKVFLPQNRSVFLYEYIYCELKLVFKKLFQVH
jgi:hypothetical protein